MDGHANLVNVSPCEHDVTNAEKNVAIHYSEAFACYRDDEDAGFWLTNGNRDSFMRLNTIVNA